MKGNFHVRFLEGGGRTTACPYSTAVCRGPYPGGLLTWQVGGLRGWPAQAARRPAGASVCGWRNPVVSLARSRSVRLAGYGLWRAMGLPNTPLQACRAQVRAGVLRGFSFAQPSNSSLITWYFSGLVASYWCW